MMCRMTDQDLTISEQIHARLTREQDTTDLIGAKKQLHGPADPIRNDPSIWIRWSIRQAGDSDERG